VLAACQRSGVGWGQVMRQEGLRPAPLLVYVIPRSVPRMSVVGCTIAQEVLNNRCVWV